MTCALGMWQSPEHRDTPNAFNALRALVACLHNARLLRLATSNLPGSRRHDGTRGHSPLFSSGALLSRCRSARVRDPSESLSRERRHYAPGRTVHNMDGRPRFIFESNLFSSQLSRNLLIANCSIQLQSRRGSSFSHRQHSTLHSKGRFRERQA